MRAARTQGKSASDFARIRRDAVAALEPTVDRDSPDASALIRKEIAKRRAGRPAGSGSKEQVAIRFDHDVLTAFRAEGPGWQTRMNAAVREWLVQHPRRAYGT
jgi:uncharacterized protein (DUF4415 family)